MGSTEFRPIYCHYSSRNLGLQPLDVGRMSNTFQTNTNIPRHLALLWVISWYVTMACYICILINIYIYILIYNYIYIYICG